MKVNKLKDTPEVVSVEPECQQDADEEELLNGTPQIRDFSLTQNQHIMISSKLPKGISLQPVRSLQKSRKLLSEISDRPLKRKQKEEKQEEKKNKDRLRRQTSRMTIQSNQQEDQNQSIKLITDQSFIGVPRKSERIFLQTDKKVYYDLEKESQSEPPSIRVTEELNLSLPTERSQQIAELSEQAEQVNEPKVQIKISPKQVEEQIVSHRPFHKQKQNNRSANIKLVDASSKAKTLTPQRDCKSESKTLPPKEEQSFEQKFKKEWQILKALQKHSMIDPFSSPVDQKRDCAPRYYKIIQKPIDLQTIEQKLKNHTYQETEEFHEDVKQMWKNCRLFNKAGSAMVKLAAMLEKYYENLRKKAKQGENKRGRKR